MTIRRVEGAWVVTGAASGFGREFAMRLSARGETVALWDLNEEGLAETAKRLHGSSHREVVDVRDAEAVVAAAERTREAVGRVGHVVHSAGVLRIGDALEVTPADYRLMMEVNYLGSVHMTQAFVPEMKKLAVAGRRATLLLIASVAGLRGFPELAGYSASKFAVVGFAQALRDELAGSGVDVRVLCPPPGDTPMIQDLDRLPSIYGLSRLYGADEVVDAALAALDAPGFLALVDARSKLLWRVMRAAPALVDQIVRRAAKR